MMRALIAVAVAGVCLVGAAPATATFPGANGRIAYDGPDGIHTVRANGTGDQFLVDGLGPSWSADGQRIAYGRLVGPQPGDQQTEIFTMRADGSDQRRLTFNHLNDGSPAYSPNGHRMVFSQWNPASGTSHVLSMRVDGSDKRVLGKVGSDFAYSPDGRHIAYLGPGNDSGPAIWVMRRNGSHKHQLSHPKPLQWDASVDYSPNGKRIIFSRFGHRSGNFVMRSDGSRPHRVKGCGRGTDPVYSPNGRKLAWTGASGFEQGTTYTDIFTSTKRCADPFQVTHYGDHGQWASNPSWQPLTDSIR